ncbi:hypothetical protein, partial [Microcoleus sp. D3_18a_C4]|uniref:hypothetical protein n=1 Tax=Microcoleus sp. D3_18a_C4 TaxID=3055332 RepID=UPI002FD0A1E8
MKEEGSSATDFVTDVTDVRKKEEVRGKRFEGRRKTFFFPRTSLFKIYLLSFRLNKDENGGKRRTRATAPGENK